jgi:hypothetical protein
MRVKIRPYDYSGNDEDASIDEQRSYGYLPRKGDMFTYEDKKSRILTGRVDDVHFDYAREQVTITVDLSGMHCEQET